MKLDELRLRIDEADRKILEAFEERMNISKLIGEDKRLSGKAVFDPAREKDKISGLTKKAGYESRPYVGELYEKIFEISRKHQEKPLFAVLGKSLPHTYSPMIHSMLTDSYTYTVAERDESGLDDMFKGGVYGGFNVTIPYKKEAAARCSVLSDEASATGAVNTVVFKDDGRAYGYNTDVFGFEYMLRDKDIDPDGKKCLILGHGGAAAAVEYALRQMGSEEVIFAARRDEINFENVYDRCPDAELIVNCTPVGMYPEVDGEVVDLEKFPKCGAFADLIYNPHTTRMLMKAQRLGMKTVGGLMMLVAQAWKASRIFEGKDTAIDEKEKEKIRSVFETVKSSMMNIVLIGMPGCGKTTLGRRLSKITGRDFIDLDEEYKRVFGESAADTIRSRGEDEFRKKETEVASKILPLSGKVISCGGGIVTRDINRYYVRCNSTVVWLKRPLSVLAGEDRPVTAAKGVEAIYEERRADYESWSDITLEADAFEDKEGFLREATDSLRQKLGL